MFSFLPKGEFKFWRNNPMRKEIFEKISQDYRKYYLSEFSFDDEQRNITFNIVCIGR